MSHYSQSFETLSKEFSRFEDDRTTGVQSGDISYHYHTHKVNSALVWNVPLHGLPNFQGHGYLKGMNRADTKQYARAQTLDELLIQVIAAHKGIKSVNTFNEVDYTEAVKEAKCIIYIPKHNDGEGIYELRRGDIISDFRYERQKAARRNLEGLTTFVFDIDRFAELGDFGFEAADEAELVSKLNKQYSIYYDKKLRDKVHSGGNFQEHHCLFERNTSEKYPLIKIKLKKKNINIKEYKYEPDLTSDCPFTLLGVRPPYTKKNIREAYKEASMRFHPDKGGDEEDFKKLQQAYNDRAVQYIINNN